ncbi:MAG: Gfo/Idh/MocA family oxidoreductase [bacterium]|nr:Gfo/Idh/MocA family oxidoreductase [bacterium]
MAKLRFAMVGCGRILRKHAGSLTGHLKEDAEMVAVCDIKPQRAKEAGEKYGVPYFTSYDEMLKTVETDVVTILTESGNHAVHTIDIVKKYRKHIVVEKPMALLLDDADKMIRACDEAGVKLFVVKQNRYNLPVMKLKEAMDADRFGKIAMGTVRVRWSRPQKYYDQDA